MIIVRRGSADAPTHPCFRVRALRRVAAKRAPARRASRAAPRQRTIRSPTALRPNSMTAVRSKIAPVAQRPPLAAPRVGFVSLGCPKALVDSEQILTQLRAEGYTIAPTYDGADLVVVNTCGFIDAAVEESLDAIGEALAENGKVIVTGCLGAKDGGDFVRAAHPQSARRDRTARDRRGDGRRASAPAEAARPVHRSRPCAGDQAHAAALRVSQDQRGLQSPLHVLHHSVDARRSRVAPDRRGAGRGGAPAARRA